MAVSHHNAFELVKSKNIASLNIEYQEFLHKNTGAKHIHLAADSDENVFMAAFRTVPTNSKGVAHILEHVVLCGSEKYPVNDPFMAMTSRSLKTFMNAFTSSDWTAYPFATQSVKDFDNLMSVYLDAVFAPRLEPLAFAQEGHRLEFAEVNNPESDLLFKGVVFNEMKGALSADNELLAEAIANHLFRTTTYHYNSGGDPEHITDLTYDEFKAFYDVHYHPSNAVFFTYGNLSAERHQQQLETLALNKFSAADSRIEVPKEQRYTSPKNVVVDYPVAASADLNNKTYITVNWLLGESTNIEQMFDTQLLVNLIYGNAASPLKKALQNTPLATALAPVGALDNNRREMVFSVGVAGSNPDNAQEIEQLVLSTLQDIADNGLPQQMVDAFLHQFELSQREARGGMYPYGLQQLLKMLNMTTHYGAPEEALDGDTVLSRLREKVQDPSFIKGLVQRVIDNPHRLTLVMQPSTTLAEQKQQAEHAKLADIKASLSTEEKQAIVDNANALLARQSREEDKNLLPKVTLQDVSTEVEYIQPDSVTEQGILTHAYQTGINGLVYQELTVAMPQLSNDEMKLLPIYTSLVANLGVGELDYLQTQMAKSNILGKFNCFASIEGDKDSADVLHAHLHFRANGLNKNQTDIAEFILNTVQNIRFDEMKRISELVSTIRANLERSITRNGHKLVEQSASANMSKAGGVSELLSGLSLVKFVKELEQQIQDDAQLTEFSQSLQRIHQKVTQQPRQAFILSEPNSLAKFVTKLQSQWVTADAKSKKETIELSEQPDINLTRQNTAWVINTQVNFCAVAYPTVAMTHPDAAKLAILGHLLKQNYLHQYVREQGGAYGSAATQNNRTASFTMSSYRDPRLSDTLQDFDGAANWVATSTITDDMMESAILTQIADMDKPKPPQDKVYNAYYQQLEGLTLTARQNFREQLLAVTQQDVKAVAAQYLVKQNATVSVITNEQNAQSLGFMQVNL